jgi:hypothetical protein
MMAGAVGRVTNQSGFASYVVKDWQAWMTECVILHASGVSVPELRVRFQKTGSHINNILRTDQANEIIRKIQSEALKATAASSPSRIAALKDAALTQMEEMVANKQLKEKSPFAFWEATRKTLDTVSRLDSSSLTQAVQQNNSTVNIQQNIVSASPNMLDQLRSAPSLSSLDVPENVEYLGSPPPTGKTPEPVLGSGVSGSENQGKNGLALLGARSTPSAR